VETQENGEGLKEKDAIYFFLLLVSLGCAAIALVQQKATEY
jgi:hypothetical protein